MANPKTAGDFQAVLPSFPCKDLSAFHVESLLGGGGFSHVVLARDAAGAEWALKLIPAQGAARLEDVDSAPLLLSEARIHLLLSTEPSVLPCTEAFKSVYTDERGRSGRAATYMAVLRMPVAACSVEEWLFSVAPLQSGCQGGPQLQVNVKEVLSVWVQMVNAVYRCHLHGVVHKDIKLPNFLMDSRGKVQIMDFGLSQMEGVTPRLVVGTPWTMSPAAFKHGDDGRAGDWWSLGVVLYQLMQGGAWPFKQCWWPWQKGGGDRMEAAIRRAVLAGHITFCDAAAVPDSVKSLIRGLLQPDPNRRWQLRQVLACETVTPALLTGIAERFPELRADMEDLLHIQSRAREVKALGPDGPATAAAATTGSPLAVPAAATMAGSRVAAAASNLLWRGASAVSAVAAEGALHWPVGHRHGSRAVGGGGADEAPYQPLLDGEQGAGERLAGRPLGQGTVGHGPSRASLVPSAGGALATSSMQHQQQQQHSSVAADGARVEDLLLMMPDELPQAHITPPSTPRTGTAAGPEAPVANTDQAATLGSMASGNTYGEGRRDTRTASGSFVIGEGPCTGPNTQPLASHRTVSGLQGQAYMPSPRGSRTSLHELFGPGTASLGQPRLPQQALEGQPKRATSGGRLGGLQGSAADVLAASDLATAGGGGHTRRHPGGDNRRHSWALQWQPGLLLQQQQVSSPLHQLGAAAPGPADRLSGGGQGPSRSPPLQLRQSSWVPPPPEVFASGRFDRRSDTSSPARAAAGGLAGPARGLGPWQGSGPGLQHLSSGQRLLARARRLFMDCLHRPSVKHELLDEEDFDAGQPR